MPEENNNSENPKPEENSDSSIGNEIENKIEIQKLIYKN